MRIHVADHPLVAHKLTTLRDEQTGSPVFRQLADELTRTAPLAVFGSWVWPQYFSPKVGCKVFQSVYRVADLGALCKPS